MTVAKITFSVPQRSQSFPPWNSPLPPAHLSIVQATCARLPSPTNTTNMDPTPTIRCHARRFLSLYEWLSFCAPWSFYSENLTLRPDQHSRNPCCLTSSAVSWPEALAIASPPPNLQSALVAFLCFCSCSHYHYHYHYHYHSAGAGAGARHLHSLEVVVGAWVLYPR